MEDKKRREDEEYLDGDEAGDEGEDEQTQTKDQVQHGRIHL